MYVRISYGEVNSKETDAICITLPYTAYMAAFSDKILKSECS